MSAVLDPTRCPLCGEPNACAVAAGAITCWCFEVEVPATVLERLPISSAILACVCHRCATGKRHPAEVDALIKRLNRDR